MFRKVNIHCILLGLGSFRFNGDLIERPFALFDPWSLTSEDGYAVGMRLEHVHMFRNIDTCHRLKH